MRPVSSVEWKHFHNLPFTLAVEKGIACQNEHLFVITCQQEDRVRPVSINKGDSVHFQNLPFYPSGGKGIHVKLTLFL